MAEQAVVDDATTVETETDTELDQYDFDDPASVSASLPDETVETDETDDKAGGATADELTGGDEEATGDVSGYDAGNQEPVFSDELLMRAAKVGMTAPELRQIPTGQALESAILTSERMLQMQKQLAPETTAESTPKWEPKPFEFDRQKMLDEGFDETALQYLEQLNEHYAGQMKQAQDVIDGYSGQIGELRSLQEQQQASAAMERQLAEERSFDNWVEGLGAEWEATFGKGAGSEMVRSSQEYQNRYGVFQRAQMLRQMYQQNGVTVPPSEQLFNEARLLQFSGQEQAIARREVANKLKSAPGQRIAKPTSVDKTPASPEEKALNRVNQFLADHDVTPATALSDHTEV